MAHKSGMKVPVRNFKQPSKIETFVDLRKVSEEHRNLFWQNKIKLIYLRDRNVFAQCSNDSIVLMAEL